MINKTISGTFLFIAMLLIFGSCEKDDSEKNETKISRHYDDESHNNGQNCMDCHKSGGDGESWFTVAGSVYDSLKTNPSPNGTIKLFTEPGGTGTWILTVEVDGLGNFYTTEAVSFDGHVYPVVESAQGNVIGMKAPTPTGQCNSCHGVTTDKIWVK